MNNITSPNTLIIGFNSCVIEALRIQFNVSYVISDDINSDLSWFKLHDLNLQYDPTSLSQEMIDCLTEILKSYRQFNDINSRRFYYVSESESEVYNKFIITFYIIYNILIDKKIKLIVFSNLPHEGFDFIIYQTAKFLRIRTIMCYQSLIPNRFWIADSISSFGIFNLSPKLFDKSPSNYSLPDTWFYMQGGNRDASYKFSDLIREISAHIYRLPPALIRFYHAYKYRVNMSRVVRKCDYNLKFIYFPLHLQPELTTSSVGGIYSDQLLAIEALSAWLPNDYYILLKENPKQTEKQRGPNFYRRIEALKNVVMLDRNESTTELIKNCIGVATITGTAGWEALFYNKPVLIFGAAWYRQFDGVFEFDQSLDFDVFQNTRPPDRDAIVEQLDETLTRAGRGVVDPAYAGLVNAYDDHKNAIDVANSLFRYACA